MCGILAENGVGRDMLCGHMCKVIEHKSVRNFSKLKNALIY